MNEISQVRVVAPQQRSNNNVLTATGLAGMAGVVSGCMAQRAVNSRATALKNMLECCKQSLTEDEYTKMAEKVFSDLDVAKRKEAESIGKNVFTAVKDTVYGLEEEIKVILNQQKNTGVKTGIFVALGTLAVWGVSKVIGAMLSPHTKEN